MNVVQRTFFEGLVNTSLSLSKAFVSFDVREHSALVYPVVVVRTKEEHREVPQVVLEALDVERHRPGVADLRWPPSESRRMKIALCFTWLVGAKKQRFCPLQLSFRIYGHKIPRLSLILPKPHVI